MPEDFDPVETTEEIVGRAKSEIDSIEDDFEHRLQSIQQRADVASTKFKERKQQESKIAASNAESAKGLGHGLTYAYTLAGTPIAFYLIGLLIEKATGNTLIKSYMAVGGALLGFVVMLILIGREQSKK